ncbi:MAG: hypothetical protein VB141_13805, partial [Burkholderia gladioli]
KMSLAILVSMSALAGAAYAQESTTITDPAKIAEIEQRAQALQQQQDAQRAARKEQPMHDMGKKHHPGKKAAKAEAASQ